MLQYYNFGDYFIIRLHLIPLISGQSGKKISWIFFHPLTKHGPSIVRCKQRVIGWLLNKLMHTKCRTVVCLCDANVMPTLSAIIFFCKIICASKPKRVCRKSYQEPGMIYLLSTFTIEEEAWDGMSLKVHHGTRWFISSPPRSNHHSLNHQMTYFCSRQTEAHGLLSAWDRGPLLSFIPPHSVYSVTPEKFTFELCCSAKASSVKTGKAK